VKRVLILAYFFPPLGGGGCQRTLKLVRYLEPLGWRATVVTARDADYWILDPSLLEEIPQSCEVIRVGGFTAGRFLRLLGRTGIGGLEETQGTRRASAFRALRLVQRWLLLPDAYLGWAKEATRAADARVRGGGIDAIWTTSSPESAHLAGRSLKLRHRIPWVADFRDPWVGRVTYRPPTGWHDARHRAMERGVVKDADRVTLVSEAMVRLYRERYPAMDPGKFIFLPNGFDSDDWRRAALREASDPAAPADAKHFVLLHAGQLAHRPTVHTILEAVSSLRARDARAREDLRLRFVGGNEELSTSGRDRADLREGLEIVPSQPHIDSLVAMRRAGALLLLGHGGKADALLYTGKLYEYVSSGRPVLGVLDEGPAADLIRSTGAGVVVRPGDVAGAQAAIVAWLDAWRAGKGLSVRLDPGHSDAWERQNLAAQAAEILSKITPKSTPERPS
jgi:glycosyltransferase involved in cell wall biosynthesis